MRFYDCETAPSPRRVRIFLAEKGLDIPTVGIDLRNREQLGDAFRAINPQAEVPALELDDGTVIAEAPVICRYLEELQPEPNLLGSDPAERAMVAMWERRMDLHGFLAVAEGLRNYAKGMKGRALSGPIDYEQIPELAERGRRRVQLFFDDLDQHLADSEYVACDRFTVADITALVTVDFAAWIKIQIGDEQANLRRWHDAVSSRPSAAA